MKFCPQCRRTFADTDVACPDHGEGLEIDNLIGADLGNFHIESWLGEGGMAVLYRAEHREIKLKVAVKVIKREYIEDASMAGRFVQEARMVAQLRHPHLVDIFDIGTLPDGRLYYVMELLAGRSLAQRMAEGSVPFQEFAPLLVQACDALEVAHQQGIVHRDLKPDNLFIVEHPLTRERADEPPRIKVLDFGVAKALRTDENLQEKWTRTGYIMGTPQYMAPEQIEGAATDARADIYAMGVILYELATGRLPFQAQTLGAMLKAHLVESPPAFEPSQLAPGVPIELEAVTFKALVKRPEDRYATIQELRIELQRLLAAQPPEASGWWVARAQSGETSIETLPGHLRTTQVRKLPSGAVTQPRVTAWTSLTSSILGPGPGSRRRTVWIGLGAAALLGASVGLGWTLHGRRRANPPVATADQTRPPPKTTKKKPRKSRPNLQTLKSRALEVITPALGDGDPLVRRFALEALAAGKDGHHRTLAEPLLRDAAIDVRVAAAACLSALGSQEACQALRDTLEQASQAQNEQVQLALGRALAQLGDPRGREVLEKLVQRGHDQTQLQAATALVERNVKTPVPLLKRRLGHLPPTDPTALAILGSLAQAGDAKAATALAGLLESSDARASLLAAESLARLGDQRGRRKLSQIAGEDGPRRLLAYRMLAALEDQSGFDVFRQVFTDARRPLPDRILAAQGLGASGEKSAFDPLVPALTDAEPALRLSAAGAILAIIAADPQILVARSLDWASSALGDSNWLVRAQAVALLAGADSEAAVSLLGKALRDERVEVRRAAARSLGQLGEGRQRDAVRYLGEALKDQSEEVRIAALRSLGRVHDEASAPLLAQHLATATPEEKVVAAGQLLALGDKSHVQELREGLGSSDPEVRRLAVEEAAHDEEVQKEAIGVALKDRSPEVRLQAALQLAEHGTEGAPDRDAVSVLQEAVRKGGADSAPAYAALTRLGIKPAAPLDPAALLQSRDAAV
ncbi:MAG TPA: HEAT repeat domain-containing protein, partial [Polyangia bacterium]|nr:HEAT repeat domain-containing protein [Polyangia bacterium]